MRYCHKFRNHSLIGIQYIVKFSIVMCFELDVLETRNAKIFLQ